MQTKWNSDPDEFLEEVEPVCVQSAFMGYDSQRSGGGLYLKDVEDQALVSEIFFVYMCYFTVYVAFKYGHDAFVVSESDYEDGSKLFSKCKTSEMKKGAVIQMRRSKPDEIIFLAKSLEVTRRIIELDSTANYNAACGSSTKLPCQNVFQALTRVEKSEDVKFSINFDAKTFEDANCIIDGIDLEIDGNNGGIISIGTFDFDVLFRAYDNESKSCDNRRGYSATHEMLSSPATFECTHHEYSVLFKGAFYQSNYVAVRNITANLITTVSPFGGFAEYSLIFSFVDESVDGTQIGCIDIWNYREGISIKEYLSVYSNSTIYISSSRGVDFTRCGTFNLPCRSLSYGWAHLEEPYRLIVVDLAYLTLPSILEKAEICSSTELGIPGKVEVNVKYSSSWREVILLNGSVKFEGINLVLRPMTNNTKNAITVIRGASLWIKKIISFSSITEEQSIEYMLFNIEGEDVTFDNLSIKGEKTLNTTAFFNIVSDADLLQLKDVSIENVKIKHDLISISPDKTQDAKWMDQRNRQTILISNLSFVKMNDLADSERSSGNAKEEILGGRLLRSRESARQKLELHNSSLSGFMSLDDFEPYGGCIYWNGKKRDGKDSSTASEDDEAEESSELLFKNCTFCNDGLDTQLHEKETKGGAIYLANIGLDIFIRCPNVSNKKELEKFSINFYHPLWKEQNSIEAESEEEGKVVDYLEFLTYRNSIIYVSGYDSSEKNCRTEQTSTFSSHSSSNNSQRINDGYVKQESGWDIFNCGSKDNPCRTVSYAMTHLTSPTPSISQKVLNPSQYVPDFIRKMQIFGEEDKDEHLTLRIIGEPSIFSSVTWNSLSVEGEADIAGLLFEKSEQEANSRQGIEQKANLF
ncbi:uncharacterized protein MONOS_7133 [Monocercomonoides exilis]|uniref:uncharacterized protein n=1 Tax=Monocercomonoides exilis TaxID=2049356 RepID=UPI003559929F|nr:hypothetical protein MONOS_7133 [Monocercomonoides exilis]|eukprot:MONOS_7133.1-p1 / transcript=MONOS_7133.1 / gene=MONOS_7133 / organism=Monocercomonoides_exilis_PA203 / gene_product=unspecified product / transcript_product=unspecified product / location=Mono_scaffold00237:38139-41395(-) / protein_length=866 / sequence_SO=supercontig / SO=protein_coding / is_pseudo=false